MPQQGVHRRRTATEGQVEVHGLRGAALLQDVLPEAGPGGRVEDTALLEEREGIRRQDLGPLVAVIARPVAAGKDVGKAMGEAVEGRGLHHRHPVADLVEDLVDAPAPGRVVLQVDAEVEQGELQLPDHLHGGLEVLGGLHALVEVLGQGRACVHMACDQVQGLPLPAPVLQELAGQLHGVPGDAADPGHRRVIDLGQHVVQAVAELVEQGLDLGVGQERGLAVHRGGEVADQIGDRDLVAAGRVQAVGADIHPGPAALVLAGIGIEIELPAQGPGTDRGSRRSAPPGARSRPRSPR